MNCSPFFAGLLLVLPLAASAQTSPGTPPPAGSVVTETTEDLDPATGKVIRRTTRTYTVPGSSATPSVAGRATTPAAMPSSAGSSGTAAGRATAAPDLESSDVRATDAQVSAFLGRKTALNSLSSTALVDAYNRFVEKVRNTRHNWKVSDWNMASAVLSSLNGRYEQVRGNMSLDDKINIRTLQAEYHALRTGRQISDTVSDKL